MDDDIGNLIERMERKIDRLLAQTTKAIMQTEQDKMAVKEDVATLVSEVNPTDDHRLRGSPCPSWRRQCPAAVALALGEGVPHAEPLGAAPAPATAVVSWPVL
jgi:hypothetical protein